MDDPNRRRILALALALAPLVGCANPVGTTAKSFLHKIREDPDPNVRHLAFEKIGAPGSFDSDAQKVEAVTLLSSRLNAQREPAITRAVICRSLGTIGRPEARPALLSAIDDPEAIVRTEACVALGRVGKPEDSTVLARIAAADTSLDGRIAAIDGLGELRSTDPRIITVLLDGMEHDDPAVRMASLNSLRKLTKQEHGADAKTWRKMLQKG